MVEPAIDLHKTTQCCRLPRWDIHGDVGASAEPQQLMLVGSHVFPGRGPRPIRSVVPPVRISGNVARMVPVPCTTCERVHDSKRQRDRKRSRVAVTLAWALLEMIPSDE